MRTEWNNGDLLLCPDGAEERQALLVLWLGLGGSEHQQEVAASGPGVPE